MTDTRIIAYLPNGASQGVLPTPDQVQAGFVLNDVGSLTLNYDPEAPRVGLLGQPLELALEVSTDGATWAEPKAARFLYYRDGRDPITPGDPYQVQCPTYIQRLTKALVAFANLGADGQRKFTSATPGAILNTLFNEAQARGAMTGMAWDFTDTTDSSGAAWPVQWTVSYAPGTDYLSIVQGMADAGLIDYTTTGRTIQVYVAGSATGLAADKTTAANPVTFRYGRDLTEAPFQRTWEALADTALVLGDQGANLTRTNANAVKPWGRQETFLAASGVTDQGTLTTLADASLALTQDQRTSRTFGLDFATATYLPFTDYQVGNWVFQADDGTAPQRVRVRQITLTRDSAGVTAGNVVLNDRFLEADIRLQRKIDRLLNGATQGGTGTLPAPVGNDILQPAAVSDLNASTASYIAGRTPRSQVTLDWSDVTTNADGTAISDLDHYEVERRAGTTGGWDLFSQTDVSTASSDGYAPGTVWQFRVRAVDTVGNRGGFSPIAQVTMAADTTAPAVPSAPTGLSQASIQQITWDGLNGAGQDMAANVPDFDHVEVHRGAAGFVPVAGDHTTWLGSLFGRGTLSDATGQVGVSYDWRLIAVDTSGNASGPSGAVTVLVDSPGAPAAPTVAPAPTVTGSIRGLNVAWAPVQGQTFDTEVHVSTVAGHVFAQGDAATLAATVGGTQVHLETDPGTGAAMQPGTDYYVATFAVNESGSAGPSGTVGPTQLVQVNSSDIAVDAAWVGTMTVDHLQDGDLSADVAVVGSLSAYGSSGESVSLSGDGFYVRGPIPAGKTEGPIYVQFPTDGSKPNIFSGVLDASTLVLEDGGTLGGSVQLAPGAEFLLGGQIIAPKNGPAVVYGWDGVNQDQIDNGRSWYGLAHNTVTDTWWSAWSTGGNGSQVTYGITQWNADGTVARDFLTGTSRGRPLALIWQNVNGGMFFVLRDRYGEAGVVDTLEVWNNDFSVQLNGGVGVDLRQNGGGAFGATLGWDHVSGQLIHAYYNASWTGAGNVPVAGIRFDHYPVNADGSLGARAKRRTTAATTNFADSLAFADFGTFDMGGTNYYVTHLSADVIGTAGNVVEDRFLVFTDAEGAGRSDALSWYNAGGYDVRGGFWDGANFHTIGAKASRWKYTGGETYWTTGLDSTNYWSWAYTWADTQTGAVGDTGRHETDLGKAFASRPTKRSRPTVTVGNVPTGGNDWPDSANLYLAQDPASTPAASAYVKQVNLPAGTTTWTLDPTVAALGGAPPAANNFPMSDSPAGIVSNDGGSYWYGDNTAKFYQLTLASTTDVNTDSGNKPPLRVGDPTALHLRIDGNEIQAMSSDTTGDAGTLILNNGGGLVRLGGWQSAAQAQLPKGSRFSGIEFGAFNVTTNASAIGTFNHSLGVVPDACILMARNMGVDTFFSITNKTATQIQFRADKVADASSRANTAVSGDYILFCT